MDRDLRFQPAEPTAAATLSAGQVRHYNEHGYIGGLDVFDDAEMVDIRRSIDDLLEAVTGAGDGRDSYAIDGYHLVCRGLWDLGTEDRILDCVQDLLGPRFVFWASHLFAKMPGDGKEVPFHQDAVYWPLTPARTVTAWLAIDDTDATNAAMQFVPASHRHGALAHRRLDLDGTRVLDRQVDVDLDRFGEPVVDELRAGQMSLHSDLLLHGSGPNTSPRRRAGLTLRYAAAEVRLIDGHDHQRLTAVHCRGGDPDGFWSNHPRPDGEHPEAMV
jgi:non-haem Fe2+, alpha-ketoglutarate-dependent halogenase